MVVRELRDINDSARGNWSLGRDLVFLTVQGKVVVRERRDVTDSARGKGTVGRDVMFQCKGERGWWGDVMLQTV